MKLCRYLLDAGTQSRELVPVELAVVREAPCLTYFVGDITLHTENYKRPHSFGRFPQHGLVSFLIMECIADCSLWRS